MINDRKFEQTSCNDSTNYQAENMSVIRSGMSYSECKEVALDVYKANYLQLSQEAGELAYRRAEHLIDRLLDKLREQGEQDLSGFKDPGVQTAIYDAQRAFIRTGDEDLESVLVELLKERMTAEQRDLKQIILDEALKVSASLTSQQMDILSLNFILTSTYQNGLRNLEEFYDYLETSIKPLTTQLTSSAFCYQHMKYTGCCSLFETSSLKPIERLFHHRYPVFFSKGFTLDELEKASLTNLDSTLLLKCFHYPNLIQFNAYNTIELEGKCKDLGLSEKETSAASLLFNKTLMNYKEIKEHLEEKFGFIKDLTVMWKTSDFDKVSLSSVGIAIGQINYKLKTGKELDVNIWLKPGDE